jgi:hypothetical protein
MEVTLYPPVRLQTGLRNTVLSCFLLALLNTQALLNTPLTKHFFYMQQRRHSARRARGSLSYVYVSLLTISTHSYTYPVQAEYDPTMSQAGANLMGIGCC